MLRFSLDKSLIFTKDVSLPGLYSDIREGCEK